MHAWGCRSHFVRLWCSRSSALVFHAMDMEQGVFNVSVGSNHTLTYGVDLPGPLSLVADAVLRHVSAHDTQQRHPPLLLLYGLRKQPLARKLHDVDMASFLSRDVCTFADHAHRVCGVLFADPSLVSDLFV